MWDILQAADTNHDIITCNTYPGNHWTQNAVGLAKGHAYTVMGVKNLHNFDGESIRLVKIRNPWGKETFNGDWSDESGLWTPGLRQQAGSVVLNDGEFFMSIDDF